LVNLGAWIKCGDAGVATGKLPGFPRLLENPESPGFLFQKFPGSWKSWKMNLVLESPGNQTI